MIIDHPRLSIRPTLLLYVHVANGSNTMAVWCESWQEAQDTHILDFSVYRERFFCTKKQKGNHKNIFQYKDKIVIYLSYIFMIIINPLRTIRLVCNKIAYTQYNIQIDVPVAIYLNYFKACANLVSGTPLANLQLVYSIPAFLMEQIEDRIHWVWPAEN